MVRITVAAILVGVAGCGKGENEALTKELQGKDEALAVRTKEASELRRRLEELTSLLARVEEESRAKIDRAEAARRLSDQRAEELTLDLLMAGMVSQLHSNAFVRAGHISKELSEGKEAEGRSRLVRNFWKGELAEVHRLATLEDMMKVTEAIRRFRMKTGKYPPSGNKNLASCLLPSDGQQFLQVRAGGQSANGELLDAWGRPYVYVENRSRDLPESFPNRHTYLLYSLGPNGKDDSAPDYPAAGHDDVFNWRQ